MGDPQIARPLAAVAEHDDLVGLDFDAGGNAGAVAVMAEVLKEQGGRQSLGRDVAQRQSHTEGAGGACQGHGLAGARGRQRQALFPQPGDALGRQARGFHLNEMDILDGLDPGIGNRRLDGLGDAERMVSRADMLMLEHRRESLADS